MLKLNLKETTFEVFSFSGLIDVMDFWDNLAFLNFGNEFFCCSLSFAFFGGSDGYAFSSETC